MHKRVGWLCTFALLSSWAYPCGPGWLMESYANNRRSESLSSVSSAGQQSLSVPEKRVQKDCTGSSDGERGNDGRITKIREMIQNVSKKERELLSDGLFNETN